MNFNKTINISDKQISKSSPVFIIAEAGVNHNGDINIAKKLIDIAVEAKVDAVKFQTFKTEKLILKDVIKAQYQTKTTNKKESQYEMLKKLELTLNQNLELYNYCKKKKIIFLTTPFDEDSLDELDKINLPAYKIASTDITNLLFLKKIALKNKPLLLSTGMCYLSEIELALNEIYPFNKNIILLQCTANYPINDNEVNLNVLKTYMDKFNILVGYSDHSIGIGAAPYAVSMGAKIIEKHFTINKKMQGPDHKASLTPEELKQFVKSIKKAETYLGTEIKKPTLSEIKTRKSLQKCLVANKNIKKGELFTDNNIVAKRTGGIGISPILYKNLIGHKANKNYKKDDIINE
ncbi:MAG: N-acetylneuraminate synthase [Bacteroidales bacterium]|jgi:N-acetylneuraminate synthase